MDVWVKELLVYYGDCLIGLDRVQSNAVSLSTARKVNGRTLHVDILVN